MRLLLDENLSPKLARLFSDHDVTTVAAMGWQGLTNGRLLSAAEDAGINLMLTADANMAYQQSIVGRKIGVMVLPTNRIPLLTSLQATIVAELALCLPGRFHFVAPAKTR